MQVNELVVALNKLLQSEYEAIYYYFITSRLVTGQNYEGICEHFEEHIEEEVRHADIIIEILRQSNLPVNTSIVDVVKSMHDFNLDKMGTSQLIEVNRDLEKTAVKNYSDLYKAIHEKYPSIADKILRIVEEEKSHEYELNKLLGQRSSQDVFSAEDKKLVENKEATKASSAKEYWKALSRTKDRDNFIKQLYLHVDDEDKDKFVDIVTDIVDIVDPAKITDEVSDLSDGEYDELVNKVLVFKYSLPTGGKV